MSYQPTDEELQVRPDLASVLAQEMAVPRRQVAATLSLLEEGATVPFIARYRKEATGGLDETAIRGIEERGAFHRELAERKSTILAGIHEQGKLTAELAAAVRAAATRSALEDLYLPYRPKRRTRATMAKEKGLEPLADRIWAQEDAGEDPLALAAAFVDLEKEVPDAETALQGARDILAERIAETAPWRAELRAFTWERGTLSCRAARGKAEVRSKFEDYYDYRAPVKDLPGHRVLAIRRGESEGFLRYHIGPDDELARGLLRRRVIRNPASPWRAALETTAEDAWDRLLSAQIETELRVDLKRRAEEGAVDVFAANLRDLLLAAPFGPRPLLAVDPGMRTGCKVVVLDATGDLQAETLVHPTPPRRDVEGTLRSLDRLVAAHPVEAVAVGNGTGGRETFDALRDWARAKDLPLVLVNEAGASVYSASELAGRELPDQDVTVRGAVSIGRRLQDPLAELVKIDPKSIGVGQYQHDVDQRLLAERLGRVVVSCVNHVGVDLNTASPALLTYVSGLSPRLAEAVVRRRQDKGVFRSRRELLEVSGLGPKTFEQAAGFLRVRGGHPLDDSAVHPERYALVEKMAADQGCGVADLLRNEDRLARLDLGRYEGGDVGRYTLQDILDELRRPGRDPRKSFETVAFDDAVREMEDLRVGMALAGVVTNVTHFGAFVDVGVHQDGLVHVSQIAHRFVRDPAEEVHVGQSVKVQVMEVDLERRRIALSIKALLPAPVRAGRGGSGRG